MSWLVIEAPGGYRIGRILAGAVEYRAGPDANLTCWPAANWRGALPSG